MQISESKGTRYECHTESTH